MDSRVHRMILSIAVAWSCGGVPHQSSVGGEFATAQVTLHGAALASQVAASILTPTNSPSINPSPTSTQPEIEALAARAYLWGWPLVYVHNCREALSILPGPGVSGGTPVAPPNQLSMLTDYISPLANAVPCPNQDVVYGFAILDFRDGPVVVQVPDFGSRFWIYQLGDQRTDSFAKMGSMYGTKPGMYLLADRDWHGPPPPGFVDVFRCSTKLAYCLPRIAMDDTDIDRQQLRPVLDQIMIYPLDSFSGSSKTHDWSRTRWFPRIGSNRRERTKWMMPERFFESLRAVLDEVPPLPGEETLYRQWRSLCEAADSDPQLQSQLAAAAAAAERELVMPLFEFRNVGRRLPHHWTTITNGADFGTDYLTRTAVARSNVFVNRHDETKYYYLDLSQDGLPLHGQRTYRITFPPRQLPPAKGFWSLTLYNEHHSLHANDAGQYSIGTKSQRLRFQQDGSLTITIQAAPPSSGWEANWLPAPNGRFSLYLRAYWPDTPILEGRWTPPPVIAQPASWESIIAQKTLAPDEPRLGRAATQ